MAVILADFSGVAAVIFLLISFIGWVINLINAQNPPAAPDRGPQRRPRARDRKVQNEIEQFLQEAMGNKGGRDEVPPDEIEVLEPAPPRRRAPARRPVKPRPKPVRQQQATEAQPLGRPGSGVSSRTMESSAALGAGVTTHVTDHMRERVSQGIAQHLPHAVDQNVSRHLGEFTADDHDPRASVKPFYKSRAAVKDPGSLMKLLRTPDGMRQAIVLQEILSKPRALRR